MARRPGRQPSDPAIHERLQDWGRDVGGRYSVGDWPAATLLSRLIEFGPMGASQAGAPAPLGDPRIVETERAVMALPSRYRAAVVAFYASATRFNTSLCARRARLSNRQFQDVLKHARVMLGDLLENRR
jgi:hypothetical protein